MTTETLPPGCQLMAHGQNGQLHLYESDIVIARKGFGAIASYGLKPDKHIPFEMIESIHIKLPTALVNGEIKVAIRGEATVKGAIDPNGIVFTATKQPEFDAIIQSLRDHISPECISVVQPGPVISLKNIIAGAIGLIVMIIVIASFNTDTSTEVPITTVSNSQPDLSVLNKKSLKYIANDVLGKVNREGITRISDIGLGIYNGNFNIVVTFAADDNMGNTFIREGILFKMADLAKALRNRYPNIWHLTMMATFSMKDAYGNLSESMVVRLGFTRAILYKIKFENLSADEVAAIADEKFVHPAFASD